MTCARSRCRCRVLAAVDHDELRELVVNAWRMTVPKKIWQEYSDRQQ